MGTRNVTCVYLDGKEVVRQYGQFDGHPTTVIPELMRFIKTPGNLTHLMRNLRKCTFYDESNDQSTISDELWLKIHDSRPLFTYWHTPNEKMQGYSSLGFKRQDVFDYILGDRTTGYDILEALIMPEADEKSKIVLWKAQTTTTGRYGYDAAYHIDLNAQTVLCNWHDSKMVFDFNDFPDNDMQERFEYCECGGDVELSKWNSFVYIIVPKNLKKSGRYYKHAFTDYNRAMRELSHLNEKTEQWYIKKVRLPWVGRSLCYVCESYDNSINVSKVFACMEHAKQGVMWQNYVDSMSYHPDKYYCWDGPNNHYPAIVSENNNELCYVRRIRVIKDK